MNRIAYAPKLQKIMELCGSKRWTWSDLSRESGRTRSHISRLMGGYHHAGVGVAEDIAAALGVDVLEIWQVSK